jgi:hypothetical protein
MMKYMTCLKANGNNTFPCRVESGDYLQCRMQWCVVPHVLIVSGSLDTLHLLDAVVSWNARNGVI